MAEYIDRDLIEWYGCNFENASCKNRECSGCSHAECSHSQVMQIPKADVIEREKIDKAIEEMQSIQLVMFCDEMQDLCIEILKKHVGGEL